jgi:toxin FitB
VNGFLLDTNVLSEFAKPRPDPIVVSWLNSVRNELLYVSVLTFAEIRSGILNLQAGTKRTRLEAWLDGELAFRFGGRLLPVDRPVADRWAQIHVKAMLIGRPLPTIDALLAATALQHNLTFATRDTGALSVIGVQLFNPWET